MAASCWDQATPAGAITAGSRGGLVHHRLLAAGRWLFLALRGVASCHCDIANHDDPGRYSASGQDDFPLFVYDAHE